jgi:hypothetical protein
MKTSKTKNEKQILSLLERILIGALPLKNEGSYVSLIVVKDLRAKVAITQDEIKKYELKAGEKNLTWNQKGAEAKFTYEFTELEKLEIKLSLEKLDKENSLTTEHLSLYEKFVK